MADSTLKTAPHFKWSFFIPAAVTSLLTMPLTAIWFVPLGALVAMIATAIALMTKGSRSEQLALDGVALAAGMYVGPAVYISLSFIT
jgi:hypothetical protein